MNERDEIFKELDHLLRYHVQASYEFFNDLQDELRERAALLERCVQEKAGSLEDVKRVVELLNDTQGSMKKRVEDLNYLTSQMSKLLSA